MELPSLSTPLSQIRGVGPVFVEKLAKLDIHTVKDLLYYLPFRYQDFSTIKNISELEEGETATVFGIIEKVSLTRTFRRKMYMLTLTIVDETGKIKAIWFNQKFLISVFKEGIGINLAGKVQSDGKKLYFSNPEYEIISHYEDLEDSEYVTRHTGRLVPIYSETKGITSKGIRFILNKIIELADNAQEFMPTQLLEEHQLPLLRDAFRQAHYPDSLENAQRALDRFAFQDLFLLQLLNESEKRKLIREKAHAFTYEPAQVKELLSYVPFELTLAQKKALKEILDDLALPHATNRLLQGDVGSGKTIVAALASLIVARQGKQSVFMAPTEVLATQHYLTFKRYFEEFDGGVALLTAHKTVAFFGDQLEAEIEKRELLEYIRRGKIRVIIGTHAVIQKAVSFAEVGLVVIDEQHRFGVKQRAALLRTKAEYSPHFLSMSATPIPRTLALTVFGDLELSIISQLPKDRKKIITKLVTPSQRQDAYAFIRKQILEGRQAYVVCPRIDPPDPDKQLTFRQMAQLDVKSVKEEYQKLSKKVFKDLRVGMLHGQMKAPEKNTVMQQFKNGELDILVSTSVIEVGVDVPNATIMMIEGSEKFGLSQLYQFRGRVGRGEHQSYCLLLTDSSSTSTKSRLNALIQAKNGFELAEIDLKLRGPGQFLGHEQTGIPDLAMKAIQNPEYVSSARAEAKRLLDEDPELTDYPYLRAYLKSFKERVHLE